MEISPMRIGINVTRDASCAEYIIHLPCYLEYELEVLGPPEDCDPVTWIAEVMEGPWRFHACA